eukprot:4740511-Lingulodinium_polyedra.AAC.1
MRWRRGSAPACAPTCKPRCCPAVMEALSMPGSALARGKMAAASRQWSGPQTRGASASSPRAAA